MCEVPLTTRGRTFFFKLVWCIESSRATESAEAPDPARRDDEE